MLMQPFVLSMFCAGLIVPGITSGQDFPNKLIRINSGAAGGGSDFTARIAAQGLSASLGQPVIVDNRSSGLIGTEIVAKAPPDGYTLLVENSGMWVGPLLRKFSYDPIKDFSPISLTERSPHIVVVHPSLPVKSVNELITLARARPAELNYADGAIGGGPYFAAELFKSMAKVNIVHVPYKVTAQGVADLIAGQVQVAFPIAFQALQHVKSGRLRGLAVTTAQPSVLAPGLPTVASSGVPGYESVYLQGLFAPAKTPAAIINRLNQEIVRIFNRADVKEKYFNLGVEVIGSSPEEFAAAISSDTAKLGKVIKDAGIQIK